VSTPATSPLVEVRGLTKEFPLGRGLLGGATGTLTAVNAVDLELQKGECLSIVGESGSGKTTLGRCIIRLIEPTSGSIRFRGEDLTTMPPGELRARRRHFQMVFQDPYGSLNPRMTVGKALAEPLRVHGTVARDEVDREVARLLERVGSREPLSARVLGWAAPADRDRSGARSAT